MHFRAQRKLQGEVSLADTLETGGEGGSLSLMDVIAVDDTLPEDLDTREIKELTAVLRELMNLQQTLEGQQPGGVVRVELAEEAEDWGL